MPENQSDLYRTRSLAEAGALKVKGQNLIRVEREGVICWFLFENKKECEQLSSQFYFGSLQVNAREYQDALKTLKTVIFNS